ncbi:RNA polymerase factor sigma-54 [Candidatus Sumerlaeota bacterium]|nr:RNA polymerase factor sigma-54 [Candidatus Sumerlaeota bacterium]
MQLKQVPKLAQKLVITPRMQLSLKLLQLNRMELEELTRQELEQNPFLESVEMETGTTQSTSEDGASNPAPSVSRVEEIANSIEAAESQDTTLPDSYTPSFDRVDVDWDDYYNDSENPVYTGTAEGSEESDFTQYTPATPTLYEHLYRQLRVSPLEGKDFEIGKYIIGSLNHNGYLTARVEDIAQKFATTVENVERVLQVVQGFEPTGIAARDIKECLQLQLKDRGEQNPLVFKILNEYFDLLMQRKLDVIATKLGVKKKVVEQVYNEISHLDPRPARNFGSEQPHYIVPDIIVEKDNGQYHIYLNDDASTHLRINSYYRNLLRNKRLDKEARKYAEKKYRGALWLIRNIERRRDTILRVTRAIIDEQKEFLDKGIEYLKPLTLREIAEKVGMHESTIQRVTTGKYVQTPRGLYELKFFFSSGVDTSDGTTTSSTSVKDRIRQIIAEEDHSKPLSDQKIAELLRKEGINIARRTVAKYREQLKILPAKLRRSSQ